MGTSLGRLALNLANGFLVRFNVRAETLTLASEEARRIDAAAARGDFDQPVYALPDSFRAARYDEILTLLPQFTERFATFRTSGLNDVGYEFGNGYFSSPDAEVLYTVVMTSRPQRISEIGCGNSTKIVRQAINDGGFQCHHRCIDPFPRQEISALADQVIRQKIETIDPSELASELQAGDILFIDTSHEVTPSNDVAYIYGRLLPQIRAGVVVHIHDIFLPYEYPLRWVKDLGLSWGEQYIVQAMLTAGDQWEVLWPGYYLQRMLSDFPTHFPNIRGGNAQSLWMRRV